MQQLNISTAVELWVTLQMCSAYILLTKLLVSA